jgi:hypothetical protein
MEIPKAMIVERIRSRLSRLPASKSHAKTPRTRHRWPGCAAVDCPDGARLNFCGTGYRFICRHFLALVVTGFAPSAASRPML